MKPLERLRQAKATAVARMSELNALGKARETGDMTDAEKTEYAQCKAQAETLDAQIKVVEEALAVPAEPKEPKEPRTPAATQANAEELKQAEQRARNEEQLRQQTIRERVKTAGLALEFAEPLVKENLTAEQASEKIFAELARKAEEEAKIRPNHAAITRDAADAMREGMANAMMHRQDATVKLIESAKPYVDLSLYEMAKECLKAKGISYQGESKMRVAELALTTSDFPNIAGSVVNATLRRSYEAAPSLWKLFSRQTSASDFRTMNSLQLGENPQLELVNEHGEFKYGSVVEGKETWQLKTYGKIIAFTRQLIINDNLGAITRVASDWGTAAATLEANIVWGIITTNAAMITDGVALFHATHNNLLTGGGSALAVAGMAAAVAKMAVQKGLDGVTLINVMPKYVLVPAALQFTISQIVGSLVPATTTAVVPDYLRAITPIADPRLDANSATAWYLAADPNQVATIDYAYLNGQEGVYTETRVGFNIDAVEYKARLDFAAKAIDFRGLLKNNGA